MMTERLRLLTKLLPAGLLLFLAACQTVQTSDPGLVDAALKHRPTMMENYILGRGDQVLVNVWRNPDLSGEVTIRPDGKLSSPLVGDITAAGLTPEQLAALIRDKIGIYVREPQVSVIVTSSDSYAYRSRVRVTGAVREPISLPYTEGMNVLDVLLSAGGLNDFANGNQAVLYRPYEGQTVVIPVRADDLLKRGDLSSNYNLLPGDILTVPEKVL